MKTRHAIPENNQGKSQHFNHYAEIFKVFKKGSKVFKPISVLLATLGLLLSLSLIQFQNGKPSLPFGFYTILPAFVIFYFVFILFSMNEKSISTLIRYIFLGTSKEKEKNAKKWFNISDIIFHSIVLILVVALTMGFISINHNAGESIGLALRQTKDNSVDNEQILTQDSSYLAKKDTIESKYLSLFENRSKTVDNQIVAEKQNLKLINRSDKEARLEQSRFVSSLEAKKVKIQDELDSLKAVELAELALLYQGSTGNLKASMKSVQDQFLKNAQKAVSLITKFLGFDVVFVIVCAVGLEIINQKNGIQPIFEVEHGDFDEPVWKEVLLKYPRIWGVRLTNWARRRYVPAQDAPKKEGFFYNRSNFREEVKTEKTKKGNSRVRGQHVFTNARI